MKKIFYLPLALLLFAGAVHAQATNDDDWWYDWNGQMDIELQNDDGQPVDSLHCFLSVSDVIFIGHKNPSYYQRLSYYGLKDSTTVVITKENNDTIYLKESGIPSFTINMNYTLIPKGNYTLNPNGNYTLNIFWHDTWWRGDFTFKTHWPEGEYVYVDSVYYRLNKGNATTIWPDYFIGRSITLRRGWDWNKPTYRDYPDHLVIPSELTYEGETYKVTRIDPASFKWCYYMLSVSLPNTITSIGNGAFLYCENLRHITIPESVTELGLYVFGDCISLSDIVIPEGITTLGNQMFSGCSSLSAVTLPSSLTYIDDWAFQGCSSLPYIEIPANVTYIGERAFQGCGLTEIKLPTKLKEIGKYAFNHCNALASIVIPESTRTIGAEAFAGCTSLASVTLPITLTAIDELAFTDIPNSAHIYCKAQKPFKIATHAFNYNCTLHVPQGCKEAYEEADFWKNFTTIVEDEEENGTEFVFAGDVTGVSPAVEAEKTESSEQFYDLQGRPVDGTQKGILIRNGKKVLVK